MTLTQQIKRRFLVYRVKYWHFKYIKEANEYDCGNNLLSFLAPRIIKLKEKSIKAYGALKAYDDKIGFDPLKKISC